MKLKNRSKAFEIALSLVQADIIAEKVADKVRPIELKPVVVEKLVAPPKPSTKIVDMSNEQVSEKRWLINEVGEGTLHELALISNSKNYSLTIIADDKPTHKGSWTNYETKSGAVTDIVAYQKNTTYALNLSNITFTKNLKILIEPTETITFNIIYLKYEIAKI